MGSGSMLSLEFGRLATAFVMPKPNMKVDFLNSNTIIFENFTGIFSFYDSFTKYTVSPKNVSYQIKQITDGSVYVSDEADGTISLYSIDIVAELSFYDGSQKMSDMILFPGMYVRFDPSQNRILKDADLYRIMLVIQSDKEWKPTGIEFANPRVKNGSEYTFFMYRLPTETRPLFQMLHILFRDRISQVDMIKNYQFVLGVSSEREKNIFNPSKRNYYLLQDLQIVLSDAVQSQKMDKDTFWSKIQAIYDESKSLVAGNSVQKKLEDFLTNSRFATFGTLTNTQQFEAMYTQVAAILGITPVAGKWKFFQTLSDIYSKNIAQSRNDTLAGIDATYTRTATELQKTLNNTSINSKDFFDIALYAYQLLQKSQGVSQQFTPESITSPATFIFIDTLFGASEKYVSGLDTKEKQSNAYKTLVAQFYAPILQSMSQSLYSMYTDAPGGTILMKKEYLDGDLPQNISPDVRSRLENTIQIAERAYDVVIPYYTPTDDTRKLQSLRDSIYRLKGFSQMISPGMYAQYKVAPYRATESQGVQVPQINTSQNWLEIYQAPVTDTENLQN